MEIENFRQRVGDSRRTKDELKQMRINAIEMGDGDCARIAEEVLDKRFPGWKRIKRKRNRSKTTLVRYGDEEHEHPSSKEAYVWLLEKFIDAKPNLFIAPNWETDFVAVGRARNYFDRDPISMFHESIHLADNPTNYHLLRNGWYANVNLSNERKFDILCRFAAIAKLKWDDAWYWEVLD